MRTHPVAGILFVCLAVSTSWAQPLGTAFTYQGRLKNGGSPANGSFNMDFKLYAVPVGGTVLASQTLPGISVSDGLFTVQVDFGPGVFDGNQRWLDVTVNGSPLLPRQELKAAPYAHLAINADRLDGLDSTAFLQSIPNPLTLSGAGNPVIRGESTSTAFGASGVFGEATAGLLTYGVYGRSTGVSGRGVFGEAAAATGTNTGVYGQSASPNGRGVYGAASATTGTTYGGQFESASPDGRGVYGGANLGTGVYGESAFADGVYGAGHYGGRFESTNNGTGVSGTGFVGVRGSGFIGGEFESTTCVGIGVKGVATCGTDLATGVVGVSYSVSGRGVTGSAVASTGTNNGVYGTSASPSGRGVYGTSTDNIGVFGEADGVTGSNFGVYGESASTSGVGVNGVATAATGTNYGVRGATASGSGWGVYSSGNFGAGGTKAFRIDHPDDPANKYLLHYCAESPEVINFYRGSVLLDGAGQAVVELPHYFAKINTAPSYQLTAIGAPMPRLHVADVIDEAALSVGARAEPGEAAPKCSFRIAGGAPGAKVSWRVEALRNDRWVQRRGAPVEVDKQGIEKDTYQHPELYGQPPEKGMNYEATRRRPGPERPLPAAPNEVTPDGEVLSSNGLTPTAK